MRVRPAPRNLNRPEELDDLTKAFRAGSDEICLEDDVAEHRHEERQKDDAEPRGMQPFRSEFFPGKPQVGAEEREELAPAAVPVAKSLLAPENREHERNEEVNHPEPGEKNVEEAEREIDYRPHPQKIVPVPLFHSETSFATTAPDGQAAAHKPQPTHNEKSTDAKHPRDTEIAFLGQAAAQAPQATQSFGETKAFFLAMILYL